MLFLFYIHVQYTHPFTDELPKKNTISGTGHTWDSPWPCLTNAAAKVRVAPAECGDAGVLHAFPGGSKGGFSSAGGIEDDWSGFNMIQPMTGWWFGTFLLFSIIYGIILPIDFHIFRGVGQPPDEIRRDLMQKVRNFPDLKHLRLWDQSPGGIPPLEG